MFSWGNSSDRANFPGDATDVSDIFSTSQSFAALKSDGSVITSGGRFGASDSSAVASEISSDVISIFSTWGAIPALKKDGSIVTWGRSEYGGDSSSVKSQIGSGIVSLSNPLTDDWYINETQSYNVAPSLFVIDESTNSTVQINITSSNVSQGTTLYYSLTGTGVNSDDFSSGGTQGSIQIDASGKSTFSLTTAADKTTEGKESFTIKLYTDSDRANDSLVATSDAITISDTSTTPAKSSYSISLKPSNPKEGDILTSNVSTKNVDPGTRLYWSFTGSDINSSDFSSGSLQGSSAIDKSGAFSLTHAIAKDTTTEGSETLKLQLFSDASRKNLLTQESLTIRDTSTTPQTAKLTGASVKANLLTLSFDGSLASTTPDTARFSIKAAGSSVGIDSAKVNANAGTVELSLDTSIKPKQPVRLSYSDLNGDQSTGVLQTPDGTDVESFSTAVTNTNKDNQPPKVTSAFINANTLTLSFSEAISSSLVPNRSWTVKENGSTIPVLSSKLDSANAQLDLQLSTPVDAGSSITLSYSDLAGNQSSNVIEDLAGNDLGSIPKLKVENRTKRSDKPLNINTAEVDADEIVLAFDRELASTTPNTGTFRVTANGKAIKVTGIKLNPAKREALLTLKSPVSHGDSVLLLHRRPRQPKPQRHRGPRRQ